MDEQRAHYAKKNKPVPRTDIVWFHLHKEQSLSYSETESRKGGGRHRLGEGDRESVFNGARAAVWEDGDGWEGWYTVNVLNAPELHP